MRFEGKLTRDGRFWLAEIPLLEAMTQGRSKKEALTMIGDWLREVASRLGASSRNAYARYERGEVVPTLEKLDALVKAASADGDFVIRQAHD